MFNNIFTCFLFSFFLFSRCFRLVLSLILARFICLISYLIVLISFNFSTFRNCCVLLLLFFKVLLRLVVLCCWLLCAQVCCSWFITVVRKLTTSISHSQQTCVREEILPEPTPEGFAFTSKLRFEARASPCRGCVPQSGLRPVIPSGCCWAFGRGTNPTSASLSGWLTSLRSARWKVLFGVGNLRFPTPSLSYGSRSSSLVTIPVASYLHHYSFLEREPREREGSGNRRFPH